MTAAPHGPAVLTIAYESGATVQLPLTTEQAATLWELLEPWRQAGHREQLSMRETVQVQISQPATETRSQL